MSEAAAKANLPEYSVSEIAAALKRTVEDSFPFVRVRGEISGLKFATSGHVYFDLKDDKAVLNAIIWKPTARALRLKPEAGLEVVVTGRVTTYPGSSRYQIIVEQIELAGRGALMAMLEERKKKLTAEGLFDAARKKKLPFLPEIVGVITSPTGAVIRDIMHRLNDRFPRRVLLWPVAVQGEKAAAEIAAAIAGFNAFTRNRPDVLIVARGGGSIEDLMAFNEEIVVRAAAASAIPLISAVGHETDTTLIDFVSDRRAPTPTAAAEMAVPVRSELLAQTMDLQRRTLRCFSKGMEDRRRHLAQLARVLPRADQLFAQPRQRFDSAAERLPKGSAGQSAETSPCLCRGRGAAQAKADPHAYWGLRRAHRGARAPSRAQPDDPPERSTPPRRRARPRAGRPELPQRPGARLRARARRRWRNQAPGGAGRKRRGAVADLRGRRSRRGGGGNGGKAEIARKAARRAGQSVLIKA